MALDVRTKSPAPYQTLVLPQDTQEEEFATLASPFDAPVQTLQTMVPEAAPVEAAPFSMENWYSDYKASDDYNSAYNIAASRYNEQADEEDTHVGEFRGYGMGTGVEGFANKLAGTDVFHNKIIESGAAKYIDNPAPFDLDYDYDYDTSKLYMKTPDTGHGTSAMYGAFGEIDAEEQKRLDTGSYVDISGGTAPDGAYSMVWIQDPPEASMFEKALGFAPLRIAAAYLSGGMSEGVIAAGRGLNGETLHASDWASIATAGLTISGTLKAPMDAAAAADAGTAAMQAADAAGLANAMEIGNAAQEAASAGTGLLGLSYGQTSQLIGAIGNQDPLNAALAISGNGLITDSLEAIGIPTELANDPDFIEGTTAALETAVAGGNLQDALQDGLVEYITEGGGFGGVPDLDFEGLASVLDPIVEAVENVGEALAPIFDSVEDIAQVVGDVAEDVIIDPADNIIDLLGSEVVDPILQAVEPVVNVIEDVVIDPIDDALDYVGSEVVDPVLQATEDVAQEVGDVIEDYVIDPVDDVLDFVGEEYVDPFAQTIGDVAEDIGQGVGDVVEDVAQVGGDVLEDIGQGVGDVVETVVDAIPDIDLPNISLPNLDLPSVGLPQVVMPSSPSATRTTDTLFGDMLKFETEITPFQQALAQLQQQQQMTSLPATQQFVNYNNLGQFLQPTQPAEGLITGRRFNT